jgi:hypothetical protein
MFSLRKKMPEAKTRDVACPGPLSATVPVREQQDLNNSAGVASRLM